MLKCFLEIISGLVVECVHVCVFVDSVETGTGRVLFKLPPNHFIPVLQGHIISNLLWIICVIYT